ncbi:uncharacterized protein TRIVIDRAFT_70730 [Trichoderma virens Gv29-8]|uniref:Uncharacterized protein n=1 Tax=Hypocrea virens (strain Gv29-8 / FGSC 10586) TaxID=413071 RepID=G9MV85_HYPVG|nr:uncharacterized protein TRIVIDRAFT_70730 [Trichoderma virens Gv29-8]EHK21670.1 hypothetical protein TRIVIDRAFT_70730 [Trichoderma virens Gv29-8]
MYFGISYYYVPLYYSANRAPSTGRQDYSVSCTEPEYRYQTVLLIQGIELKHSPKKIEEEVKEIPRDQRQGRFQTAQQGSYGVEPVHPASAFELQLDGEALVYIAATQQSVADNTQYGLRSHVTDFFNGRIDSLTLKTCGQQPLAFAKYDFSLEMSSDRILDISGRGQHGVLIKAPTRAVKGYDLDGSECD